MKITLLFKYALKERFNFQQIIPYELFIILKEFLRTICQYTLKSFFRTLFMPRAEKRSTAASIYPLLSALCSEIAADEETSVGSIKTALLALSTMQRKLLGAVVKLFQLLVILPATNATSERSFGAKALRDRIRIRISYLKGQRIGFSFVTLIIRIDVPKSEQIRIIAHPIPSDANMHI